MTRFCRIAGGSEKVTRNFYRCARKKECIGINLYYKKKKKKKKKVKTSLGEFSFLILFEIIILNEHSSLDCFLLIFFFLKLETCF